MCFFRRLDWIAVICLRYWIRRVNKVSLIEPSGDYLAQVILIAFNLLLYTFGRSISHIVKHTLSFSKMKSEN